MPHFFAPPLVIWRFLDGKPGHEKQTQGLAQALGRHIAVKIHDIAVKSPLSSLKDWLTGRFPAGQGLPDPHLLIGAGHRTHFALLAARRARGGRAVLLMRPSLPLGLFDLCLIPDHDRPPKHADVVATRGVLNAVNPSRRHDPSQGLILVGGPSSHFAWDNLDIARQINAIVSKSPQINWQLTTSRRTPADFLAALAMLQTANLASHPGDTTPPGWLEATLATAGQAWVSEDSVSMLYEALTAGCAVGLLQVPKRRDNRVAHGVERLIRDGWVMPFASWRPEQPLVAAPELFDEADRCARLILGRWFEPVRASMPD